MDYRNHESPYVACVTTAFSGPLSVIGVLAVKAEYQLDAELGLVPCGDKTQFSGDRTFDDAESLAYPTDFVPYKPKADLIVNAVVPSGSAIRLTCKDIAKTLRVFDERHWQPGGNLEARRNLQVPLRYEFTTAGKSANPLGMPSAGERRPFVEYLEQPVERQGGDDPPAAFAAISETFPERQQHIGTYDDSYLEQRWPAFPLDFSSQYYNAAPADQQQAGFFDGDETLRLDTRTASGEQLEQVVELPGERPRVVVGLQQSGVGQGARPREHTEITLVLDTLWVDFQAKKLALVWRGNFPVETVAAKEVASIDLFVESLQHPRQSEAYLEATRELADGVAKGVAAGAQEHLPDDAKKPNKPSFPLTPDMEAAQKAARDMQRQAIIDQVWLPADVPIDAVQASIRESTNSLNQPEQEEVVATLISLRAEATEQDQEQIDRALALLKDDQNPSLSLEALQTAREQRFGDTTKENTRSCFVELIQSDALIENASFHDLDLSQVNLGGASFQSCRFEAVDFSGCDFGGARFVGCQFSRSSFDDICSDGVTMVDVTIEACHGYGSSWKGAQIGGISLIHSDFSRASFQGCVAPKADFSDSQLQATTFAQADLAGARFGRTSAQRACFDGAKMVRCDLYDADFNSASFVGCELQHASVHQSNFSQVELCNSFGQASCWTESDLSESNFSNAQFDHALITDCELHKVQMDRLNAPSVMFDRSTMTDAMLTNSNFLRACFESVSLIGARVEGSNLYEAGFLLAKLDSNTSFRGSLLQNTLIEKNLGVVRV